MAWGLCEGDHRAFPESATTPHPRPRLHRDGVQHYCSSCPSLGSNWLPRLGAGEAPPPGLCPSSLPPWFPWAGVQFYPLLALPSPSPVTSAKMQEHPLDLTGRLGWVQRKSQVGC